MKVKVFQCRSKHDLEEVVNKFLAQNPVTPDSMRFQYSTTVVEDSMEHIVMHHLVLFYVPMMAI